MGREIDSNLCCYSSLKKKKWQVLKVEPLNMGFYTQCRYFLYLLSTNISG